MHGDSSLTGLIKQSRRNHHFYPPLLGDRIYINSILPLLKKKEEKKKSWSCGWPEKIYSLPFTVTVETTSSYFKNKQCFVSGMICVLRNLWRPARSFIITLIHKLPLRRFVLPHNNYNRAFQALLRILLRGDSWNGALFYTLLPTHRIVAKILPLCLHDNF